MRWGNINRYSRTCVQQDAENAPPQLAYKALAEEPQLRAHSAVCARQPSVSLDEIAGGLWVRDYSAILEAEYHVNRTLCGERLLALIDSTYRARAARAHYPTVFARYSEKEKRRERDAMAIHMHGQNMRHWSPSLVARSVTYFSDTTCWVRAIETSQRRIAYSRPTILAVLRKMSELRPQPVWRLNSDINVFCADQTYEWVGMKKRGRQQQIERVDHQGMPIEIQHMVYVNSIKVRRCPLPWASFLKRAGRKLRPIIAPHTRRTTTTSWCR